MDFESELQKESGRGDTDIVKQVVRSLSSALVYPDAGNIETNRKLWDNYAKNWSPQTPWVKNMVSHLPLSEDEKESHLHTVGDEWSDKQSLQQVVEEFIAPYITTESSVAEIGVGGGRVASRVFHLCASLSCFDISAEMLSKARNALPTDCEKLQFHLLTNSPHFDERFKGTFDFVYSFDVFVHIDLHTIWQYFNTVFDLLKPGGRFFVSFADVTSPLGWQRFAKQSKYSVGGFYFLSPEIVRKLAQESHFIIEKESVHSESNLYYNRDFLVVLRRPPTLERTE
eukprot:GILK01010079.1.p1 GENE.GILK01010079.1~~GILK01010079.1.p1  ORF type:complete len:284 (-),score=41.78 GILK01010079.1:85-936(-)